MAWLTSPDFMVIKKIAIKHTLMFSICTFEKHIDYISKCFEEIDMIWYDMIWYDMIWYDMIWYDMIYKMISWYDDYMLFIV